MTHSDIEEDFRFATPTQVANYSTEQLMRKPHLPGYDFSQLLDQLDQQVIRRHEKGLHFICFLRAPGGTALWIAKHLQTPECDNEIVISVEPPYWDSLLLEELDDMRHVVHLQIDEHLSSAPWSHPIDCNVLACKEDVHKWFHGISRDDRLIKRQVIAYDLAKRLNQQNGDYFMNSAIWISDAD